MKESKFRLKPLLIIAGSVFLTAAAAFGVVKLTGIGSTGSGSDQTTAFSDDESELSAIERLRRQLEAEGEMDIVLDEDLVLDYKTIIVHGKKTLRGSGSITAPLDMYDYCKILDIYPGASLTIEDITIDANVTSDCIWVEPGGQLTARGIKLLYPYQFGICVEGKAEITDITVDHPMSAAIQIETGAEAAVHGGYYNDSASLFIYIKAGGFMTLDGNYEMTGSVKHGITNRGTASISGGFIHDCAQYAIVNYGKLSVTCGKPDDDGFVEFCDCTKGGVYNHPEGTADLEKIYVHDVGKNFFVNHGVMDIRDCRGVNSGTNSIYNDKKLTVTRVSIDGAGNCGIYNAYPADTKVTDCTIKNITKRAVHNKGGDIAISDSEIEKCGTFGLANARDEYKHYGTLTAENVKISEVRCGVYNQDEDVKTVLRNCIIDRSVRTNVNISFGSAVISGCTILGTKETGTSSLYVAKGASCEISDSKVSGAQNTNISNHGTSVMRNVTVIGGGTNGVVNDGTMTGINFDISGSGNVGFYNIYPGTAKLSGGHIYETRTRTLHNKGGNLTAKGMKLTDPGTIGAANTVDEKGHAGSLNLEKVTISGAGLCVASEAEGVKTTLKNCTFNKSRSTNIRAAFGKTVINGCSILGTEDDGTSSVTIGKDATCEIIDTKVTGAHNTNISNHGTAFLDNVTVTGGGTNGVVNDGTLTGNDLDISGSGNVGFYNVHPGTANLSGGHIYEVRTRTLHNKGGDLTVKDMTITDPGTIGAANTADESGNAGTMNLKKVTISGAGVCVANEAEGVRTIVKDCTLNKSTGNNVMVSFGSITITGTRILGSEKAGTTALLVNKGAKATLLSGSDITGGATRGAIIHGTFIMEGGEIHDTTSYAGDGVSPASGGGVYVDGTMYMKGGSIHGCRGTSSGGAISLGYNSSDAELVGRLYMTGGEIYGNRAEVNGGGIYVSKGLKKEDNTYIYCHAELTGGRIYGNTASAGKAVFINAGDASDVSGLCVVGQDFYISDKTDININSASAIRLLPLTNHSHEHPLYITSSTVPGTTVFVTGSDSEAEAAVAASVSCRKNAEFAASGSNVIVAKPERPENPEVPDMGDADAITVTDFEQLKNAVTNAKNDTVITLGADIVCTERLTLPADLYIQISDDGTTRSLIRGSSFNDECLFGVPAGATFILSGTEKGSLILDGANVTVSGEKNALVRSSGALYFKNIVMKDGIAPDGNGAFVYVTGENMVYMEASTFTGGSAVKGAVYLTSAKDVVMTGCTFEENHSPEKADVKAGAVYMTNSILDMTDCVIKGNSSEQGGAMFVTTDSVFAAKNTAFSCNKSSDLGSGSKNGSAIYLYNNAEMTGEGLTFEGNDAGGASAVYVNNAVLNIRNSVFDGNKAGASGAGIASSKDTAVVNIEGCTFTDNTAGTYGGAINNGGGTFTVKDSVFSGNTASPANKADHIMCSGSQVISLENITIAAGSGDIRVNNNGELVVSGKAVLGTVTYATDSSKLTVGEYGLAEGSSITVIPATIAAGTQVLYGSFEGTTGYFGTYDDGDVVWGIDTDGKLADMTPVFPFEAVYNETKYSTLADAIAAVPAGADAVITVSGTTEINSGFTVSGRNIELKNTSENKAIIKKASSVSGAMFTVSSGASLTLTGVTLDGNGVEAGKALVENSGTFVLSAASVIKNGKNTSQAGGLDNLSGGNAHIYGTFSGNRGVNGGAIRNYNGAEITLYDGAVIKNNVSSANGGGLHQSGKLSAGAALFKNNTAEGSYSGAIHYGGTATGSLNKTVFEGNMTTGSSSKGGVSYLSNGVNLTMTDIHVDGGGSTGAVNGGAFAIGKSQLTVKGESTVIENVTSGGAGGVFYVASGGTLTIKEGLFTKNSSGGASSGVIYTEGITYIDGGTFSSNAGKTAAGAMNVNNGGKLYVRGGTFSANKAQGGTGGAINVSSSGSAALSGGTFSGNTSSKNGDNDIHITGTLYIADSYDKTSLLLSGSEPMTWDDGLVSDPL
ncbi:MAG: hypothetical protein IKR26_03870 [Lachnospiraceae bacterium]|nr:hypothetical protein [Lachnospiraceae bacterium]